MKWIVTTPPVAQPISYEQAFNSMRLLSYDDKPTVEEIIADTVAYFEGETESSLAVQSITCTHYESAAKLFLPRGPVLSITSITADGVAVSAANYKLRRVGNTDYVYFDGGSVSAPVVIVYQAGYATLPADIRRALLLLVGTWYGNREVESRPIAYAVDEGFRRIVNRYRRTSLVG